MILSTEKEIKEFNNRNPNYLIEVVDGDLKAVINDSKYKENEQKRLLKLYEKANIPLRYQSLDLETLKIDKDLITQAQSYINTFTQKSFHNLYIEGGHTSGKTSLLCSITKKLISKGYSGYFIYAGDLSRILQERHSYGDNLEAKKFISDLGKYDFIAIDDIYNPDKDVAYNISNLKSQWNIFFMPILDSGLNVIKSSNTVREDIHIKYGQPLQELIDRDFNMRISFKTNIKNTIKTQRQNDLQNKLQKSVGG